MSLTLDLTEIRTRFLAEWDADATTTVFANAEAADVEEARPFVRFSISPGARALVYGGGVYSQLGRVWLQIFVPKSDGTATGYALADDFTAIFRNWKTDDGCLRMSDEEIMSVPNGENGYFQINVSIRWESLRHL